MNYGIFNILQLLGALGLFLFGMKIMSDALLKLAGGKMRSILARLTSNRLLGVSTGFLITAVIQSSSATTLMVVSFANARLLTLIESITVIMGANIGTTVTAWLITILGFKVSMSSIALPLVGLGFGLSFFKKEKFKNIGFFVVGFAIIFIGLQFLKEAMPDIKNNPEILAFLSRYTDLGYMSVVLFLFIGTLLTVVIQSSSATMALTLVMTAQGWIPYEMAAAMVLGENIGTTITANLAAIVGSYRAKQTARAHLIFNLLGVLWVLILFYPFLSMVSWLAVYLGSESPYSDPDSVPVAISLFHTVFNLSNTFLLIWFVKPIARLVVRFVPEQVEVAKQIDEPKFLTKSALDYPETALSTLTKESQYLFENAIFEIVSHALNIHRADIRSDLKSKKVVKKSSSLIESNVRELYNVKVKNIYGHIINYATRAQTVLNLTEAQNNRILELKVANRKMVEILKLVNELSKNVDLYLNSENTYIQKEYNKLRKKMVKVWRNINLFRTERENVVYHEKLLRLKEEAKAHMHAGNIKIDELIRSDLITVDMASSLFNDYDNVNYMTDKLIEVADILYAHQDALLENE